MYYCNHVSFFILIIGSYCYNCLYHSSVLPKNKSKFSPYNTFNELHVTKTLHLYNAYLKSYDFLMISSKQSTEIKLHKMDTKVLYHIYLVLYLCSSVAVYLCSNLCSICDWRLIRENRESFPPRTICIIRYCLSSLHTNITVCIHLSSLLRYL